MPDEQPRTPWIPPTTEDAAFRYVRILREELLEFATLYQSEKGWVPALSKLENCLCILSERNPGWAPAHNLALAVFRERPQNWDDIRGSANIERLIDLFREAHRRGWAV